MNNRSVFRVLAIALLVMTAAAFVGVGAYNAGVARGIAESGQAITAPAAGAPFVYVWPRPWGFGFFPFFPLFFLVLLFFVFRGLFWRGPWRGGWACYGDRGVPPAFDEWHRRAHAEQPPPRTGSAT
jgi:hypothetical protein